MNFSMEVIDEKTLEAEIQSQVQPEPEEVKKLREQAESNALAILDFNLDSMNEKAAILKSVEDFGMESMRKSTTKNTLLKTTIGSLAQAGDESGQVSKSLLDLNREIKDLDPSLLDFTKTGILGKMFNPVRAYFDKFEKSEDVIERIMVSLDKGKNTLKNDNTTLALEEQNLRDLTKRIAKEVEMGMMMDDVIVKKLEEAELQGADPDKIRFIKEEILFPLRQRVMDLQQMTVINHQGIIAMEVIQRNNKELMRGVERAKTVTVSALRTAVMVASALYNQKIVLKKIQVLNETTNDLIGATSKMLREQGTQIQKQAMETGVTAETLRIAFNDAIAALDTITEYKERALPIMKNNIEQFRELADKGEIEIRRLEKGSRLNLDI